MNESIIELSTPLIQSNLIVYARKNIFVLKALEYVVGRAIPGWKQRGCFNRGMKKIAEGWMNLTNGKRNYWTNLEKS